VLAGLTELKEVVHVKQQSGYWFVKEVCCCPRDIKGASSLPIHFM